jgi:ribosomal protein S18 acetylase RimI-like enzyme
MEGWKTANFQPSFQSSNPSTPWLHWANREVCSMLGGMMPGNAITLRSATPADAEILARLWATTFADKFGPALGNKAEAVLSDWFRLSRRHLPTTTLAEIEGTVAGFIVLETTDSPRPDDGRWLWHALQLHNGLFGALRGLFILLLLDNHHSLKPNEVYIEMLGVAEAWRGCGVAHCLLGHATTLAQTRQLPYLTLNVMTDNLPAIRLYAKLGFKVKKEHHSRVLHWFTGHAGYYEMTKLLVSD